MAKDLLRHLELQATQPEIVDPVQEAAFHANEVEALAKESLDFLAALAMPTVFKYMYPPVFKSAWDWLQSYVHKDRDFSQLALGLPRGFSKTTFVKIFVLYCILFSKKKFILICANTYPKACAIISDIMDFLNEPNIRAVFGDWKIGVEKDTQDLKKFGYRGRNIVIAAGTVESVRGMNMKHERPDLMIFDDIQSLKEAESEVVSNQIERDLYGTAMKAKSPHGCLFIYVGNMYASKWSILKRIKKNPTWVKFIVGGILEDGTSLWEDLQPLEQLLKEFERDLAAGRPEVFYAEVLNDDTATGNHHIDLGKIPPYEIQESEIHQGNFLVIDPATDKANADAVTITYFEVYDGVPVARTVIEGRFSPGQTIEQSLQLAMKNNCSIIGVESNAYQYSLNYWFRYVCSQYGIIGIEAVELYSGAHSKNSRILKMFTQLIAGELLVHPECKAQVYSQITSFNPAKTNNTDGILDCLTYAPKMLELYGDLITARTIVEEQGYSALKHPDYYAISGAAF